MDIKKTGFWMACVAVILITMSCTSTSSTTATTSAPTPPVDKMLSLSSGVTSPELEESARLMGLEVLYEPSAENLTADMVGVAPLGDSCIVTFFYTDGGEENILDLQVETRYDESFKWFLLNTRFERIAGIISELSPMCVGTFDVNKLPLGVAPQPA